MLIALKAAFLENYLAGSTWVLNGSSIECHEKKHQPFSLSGVRFGSQAIQNFWVKICLALEESKRISVISLTSSSLTYRDNSQPLQSIL